MSWLHRIRLKLLAFLAGLVLAGVAITSVTTVPVWGVVGVAVVAVTFAVNTLGAKLTQPTCLGCGRDLTGEHAGEYGVACPDCGQINQRRLI